MTSSSSDEFHKPTFIVGFSKSVFILYNIIFMLFEKGHLYHIYNQGNNKENIFYSIENYLLFLSKIREYVLPHVHIIAWCLMPNHFHLMVEIKVSDTHPMTSSHRMSKNTLNQALAILLRSYTRAINKQQNRTGSLFRQKTKAECITKIDNITPSFYNADYGASMYTIHPEEEYPQVCFNYIHLNPVKAGLVGKAEDWEFSSFRDYCRLRDGKLINKDLAKRFNMETHPMT